ncbi:MAG TPA: FAD-dependent monooxygenase [Gemmataceae bacterium]|nr:FAD-dependent monooxygenase [Gemmataceae bacterium]
MNKQTSRQNSNSRRHAVVIGGSMAGVLAARILADHFERVTVVERDRYPQGPAARKGAPQARHVHVLLTRGQRILEQLFPGLADDLTAAGAPVVDAAQDVAWLTPAGWAIRFPSDLTLWSASRELLEWAVRRRVMGLPNVQFLEECDVAGLLPDAAGQGVAGVALRRRRPAAGEKMEGEFTADLVVDASGRGSHAPQWLGALGYSAPEETVVNSCLGYASRVYQVPDCPPEGWKALYLQSKAPSGTRSGLLLEVEGKRWMVTLSGRGGDYPPTDDAGFVEFTRSLPSPMLYEAIRDAKPLTPISGYRATENRLRHYERLARWPEGFVVLGDAACAFNPVYGQGMSTAAAGAMTLDQCLRRPEKKGLAKRFQRELAAVNAIPWLLATGEDYRYPTTTGGRAGWLARLQQKYVDWVVQLSTEDSAVRLQFLKVLHLIETPQTLFRPSIVLKLLRRAFSWGASQPTHWPRAQRTPSAATPTSGC